MNNEEFNIKEDIKEIISKCIRCGMCNSLCPVLRIVREEQYSPRGRAVILDNHYFERIVYECTLCKVCEVKCPLDLKLCEAFIKARQILVIQKKELAENKEMINNLQKTGNIFGVRS